ncbi:cyclodeaminase/cyclohydrolase family protein [Winogradskyella damuponensis]|uniref:Formiminotetrahydrofolate cyclodeaminase n=1 Tax=Winogradskyella damuponensis TaxID=943939 RepID=A0ABP8CJF0_9FLAO
MELNLIERTVKELMEKFGAGNHKPGSGSAAAFQGMVSAKLISTVISLCAEEKRKHLYSHCIYQLLDFQDQIEGRIYPKLEDLFQFDSEQFDKTIKLRKARDIETDEAKKNQLRREALEELKISIAIPFQIAELCKEIAEIGDFVFDNGFRAARGDSQVGISGAVSALSGCIAIIRLNVLSFNSDEYEYTKSIVHRVNDLDKDNQKLNKLANAKIEILRNEFNQKIPLFEGLSKLRAKYRGKKNVKIEECVRDLQNLIWVNKHLIWKKKVPSNQFEVLRPDIVLRQALGFDYFSSSSYGVPNENDEIVEVAGVIDQPNKLVMVSNKFPKEVQRFTAAHELGHAILHDQPVLHRDIAVECIGQRNTRDIVEIEADKFATNFLMPNKLVRREFENIYSYKVFELNEDSAFQFGGRSVGELRKECKNLRGLSRKLASTESFDNKHFHSLSEKFNVSVEAMAIRLEELKLLYY